MTDPNLIQVIEQGFSKINSNLMAIGVCIAFIWITLWGMLLFKKMGPK